MQKKILAAPRAAVLTLLIAMVAPLSASYASVEVEPLSTPELQARYLVLIEEMRCPKCQNQNLAGSDSMVATDLRREIRRLLEEGFSDQEINDYMVARYGDFVLYRPPLQRNTMLLWVAPGVFAALGLLSLIVIVARSRSGRGGRQSDEDGALSPEESRRLAQLLDRSDDVEGRESVAQQKSGGKNDV